MSNLWTRLGLVAVVLLAFAVRAAGAEWVFIGDGEMVFTAGDGLYHARRAFYSFVNFPAVLTHDYYINFPDGAPVMVPPLMDWWVAGVARLFGSSVTAFEKTLAWSTPIYGTLAVLPIYAAGRRVGSVGTALLAGALYALLPIIVLLSRVGNADHHAAVSLFGACLLALVLACVAERDGKPASLHLLIGLAVMRVVLMLSWSGSLLYLGLVEASLLLAGSLAGRRDLLTIAWQSALASAVLVLPFVVWLPTPIGGAFSASALSYLHVVGLCAAALAAALFNWLEGAHPASGFPARLLRAAGVAIAGGIALLLLLPAAALAPLTDLFSGSALQSDRPTLELMPLFPIGDREISRPPTFYFGLFAFLIPATPFAAWFVRRRDRVELPSIVLAGWCATLGVLAIWQLRFGADFAACGSIGFALLATGLGRALSEIRLARALAWPVAGVFVLLCIAPALLFEQGSLRPALASASRFSGNMPRGDRALASLAGSTMRFMESVRAATDDTAGFLDDGVPEYGVLCDWNLGHPLHYYARRASATDGFGNLLAPDRYASALGYFQMEDATAAYRRARELGARYVITTDSADPAPRSVGSRLHLGDGLASHNGPRLEHMRLITEGPQGGLSAMDLAGRTPDRISPFKLFEVVAGAILEIPALPGTKMEARLDLEQEGVRRWTYRASTVARPDGYARLRVPYPTDPAAPQGALGPYRVTVVGQTFEVDVSEAQVREGSRIRLGGR